MELKRARNDDPATSHVAAASVSKFADSHFKAILDALRQLGRMTCHELGAATGYSHVQCARRLPELERGDLVYKTDETRPSPSGRQCTVWALVS